MPTMAIDVLFALRGLLAFVAFTEFTNAGRCLLNLPEPLQPGGGGGTGSIGGSYVNDKLFDLADLSDQADRVVSHVYALYSALNGLIVLHLAIFAHYRPLVSLAFTAVAAKLLFLLLHAFVFGTISYAGNHHFIFPLVSCVVTLLAVAAVPFCTDYRFFQGDENYELLHTMKLPKTKRKQK